MKQTINHEGVEIIVHTKTAFEDDFTSDIWQDWRRMLELHFEDNPASSYLIQFSMRLLILMICSEIKVNGYLPDIDIYNPNYNMIVQWRDIIEKKRELYDMWSKAYEVVNKEEDSPLSENGVSSGEPTSREVLKTEPSN